MEWGDAWAQQAPLVKLKPSVVQNWDGELCRAVLGPRSGSILMVLLICIALLPELLARHQADTNRCGWVEEEEFVSSDFKC